MTTTANSDIWAPFLASVDALPREEHQSVLAFLRKVVTAASANGLQIDALDVDPADCLPVVCPHCAAARAICLEMADAVWKFQCVACGGAVHPTRTNRPRVMIKCKAPSLVAEADGALHHHVRLLSWTMLTL
jgi:Zn ribbon nucleic-acid-binding protein